MYVGNIPAGQAFSSAVCGGSPQVRSGRGPSVPRTLIGVGSLPRDCLILSGRETSLLFEYLAQLSVTKQQGWAGSCICLHRVIIPACVHESDVYMWFVYLKFPHSYERPDER